MKEHAPLRVSFGEDGRLECGCDEAGRGCLAGPVVAAAVILPPTFYHPLLFDSKQLSEHQRDTLRPIIEEAALAWGVGIVSPEEIDEINILQASFLAMHRAIDDLLLRPELLLIDGNRFKPLPRHPPRVYRQGGMPRLQASLPPRSSRRRTVMS